MSKEMLNRHPAALGAAVLARPGAMPGGVLAAYIKIREDAKWAADDIAAYRREHLAHYTEPRFPTRIIQKFVLRQPAKFSSAIE